MAFMERTNPEIVGESLSQLTQVQRERLSYIEFRLYFLGQVGRQDLKDRFGAAPAVATRDFAEYRRLAPNNITFDNTSKMYVIASGFSPLFEHVPERVVTALTQGFGDGINPVAGSLVPCEMPPTLNRLNAAILASITRAIYSKKAVHISYFSGTSGASQREIVPFALASDGLRWHTRAFDRKRNQFGDFVISRMENATLLEQSTPEKHELPEQDHQWNRVLELDLVPHPGHKSPELVKRDYAMKDGVFRLKIRAAMAGYVLRQWHVDCSSDHGIKDEAFRLWLRDPLALYGVNSALFAPGYKAPAPT
jgi:predicted DNA-binding transcriptional regulator YafY